MTDSNASPLPPVAPEHRRVAAGKFEHANRVVATGNYDYGIHLLLDCCRIDPSNLIYRQALRRTEKAKYHNNMRGSMFAALTAWPARARMKNALRTRDYLKVLEHGERILTKNPWDVGTQMDMSNAANLLGLLDLAVWILEQARQKSAKDIHLNRALAHLYERRGNFTQAMALWELIRKARPRDIEAQHKIKDLAADDTIARGGYYAVVTPGEESAHLKETADEAPAATGEQQTGPTPPPATKDTDTSAAALSTLKERVEREAAPLRARLKENPTNPLAYLQLAGVFRRANDLEKARDVLQEGLGPTGNAFELSLELADLDAEPFRRNLGITEEKLKADPDNAELRRLRTRLRKEINTRELDMHRQKANRYPTELSHRYEVGIRLLRAGQIDEAISELQASRVDPRHRWQSLLYLGHCFKARNNWMLAERNFGEALKSLPAGETNNRKEVLYELAVGCAEANDLSKAIERANELANLDFSYRDIGRLLDEWHKRTH
jgi:tetratricopeptide (TPR) repeat protein